MNERDPITEWEHAIGRRLVNWSFVVILIAFICCLIAPLFSPMIKHTRRHYHIMSSNYEELAENDMKSIRPILWIIALIAWIVFFICHANYP